jgi:hypothetical protein
MNERRGQREAPTGKLPRARLRHLAGRIHRLGPRALYELLAELQDGAPLRERLERYAGLAPLAPFIAALGGADLPTLRSIGESRARPTAWDEAPRLEAAEERP